MTKYLSCTKVNIHNDLIDIPLTNLNASEIDLFNAICYKCQDRNTSEIQMPLYIIKEIADIDFHNDELVVDRLTSMSKKIASLTFTITDKKKYFEVFTLFRKFKFENNVLKVEIDETFTYLLNSLKNNYTSLELKESSDLKSSYSKIIYRKLREYRNLDRPFWIVKVTDFRKYIDTPRSYDFNLMEERIIKTSVEELSKYFKNLRYEKLTDMSRSGSKAGRPKISHLRFEFDKESRGNSHENKKKNKTMITSIAELSGWESSEGTECPLCGRPLYKKMLQGIQGSYYLYGHPDFRTGSCNYTSTKSQKLKMEEEEAFHEQ